MEQPFINQDPNGINPSNNAEGQLPSNPQNMIPPNMNPPQESQPPEQPYYSTQNPNIPYDKPINFQDNQIPPPSEPYPYYPPPENAVPSQPQAQPYYPPTQAQGMANPFPQMSPQPNYPPQGIPQTNYPPQGIPQANYPSQYPPQTGGVPIQVQPEQPVYKAEYQNYNNISQIPHKRIKQPDPNTFIVSSGCCSRIFPFIFAGFGIFLMLLPVTEIGEGNFNIAAICGVIFFAIGIYLFFKLNNSVIFVMGPNTLTVIEKATCRKKTRIYNPGELQRIALDYRYIYRHSEGSGGTGGYMHEYSLIVFRTTEGAANIFSVSSSSPEFTSEEIDYFLYYINTHIQTKMMA